VNSPPSVALGRVLIDEFIAGGVTDAVLSPGSRNAALSLALHDADAGGRIRLHVRIDERTAGFLALGLARGYGRPALVVTTSGTAVANLHPAVLEAHHGAVPLIVLSADRPPALRDIGANQVIDQRGVFWPALRHFHEIDTPDDGPDQRPRWRAAAALAAATGELPGPVQLNLPMAEPLLPGSDYQPEPLPDNETEARRGSPMEATRFSQLLAPVPAPAPGERVLFVADLTHPAAGRVAAAGHPVISEAGGAAGRAILQAGISLLEAGFGRAAPPDRVIVLGRPTLFRAVTQLLGAAERVDVVGPTGPIGDPTGRAHTVSGSLAPISRSAEPAFGACWAEANRAGAAAIADRLADTDLALTPRLARDVVGCLPDGTALILGSSQLPRDVGRFAAARDGVGVIANRGVAGIDGTNSTAIGVALALGRPSVALMGDLTFLHDLTGLLVGPHEPRPDLSIVVANNDGGAIFGTLEPGEARHASAFERVFGTPHGVALGLAAQALGIEHLLVTESEQLRQEMDRPTGVRVIEVPCSRTELREWLAGTAENVRAAIGG